MLLTLKTTLELIKPPIVPLNVKLLPTTKSPVIKIPTVTSSLARTFASVVAVVALKLTFPL